MIREHAVSIRGKSHIKSNTICQDAYKILALPNGSKIAAVADGVGSAKFADRGAQIAVKTVTDFIFDNYPLDNDPISIKSMLRTSFNRALIEISKEAIQNHNSMSDYDTTLMVVIYDGKRGYYAHVGDGGIVGLKTDGAYIALSHRQNLEGCVIPLRAGYKFWQIDEINEPITSVLVATDGMMDQFKNLNLEQGFYIPLLMLFADPYCIQYQKRKGVNISKVVAQGQSTYNKTLLNALYYTLHRNYHFNKAVCSKIIRDIMKNGTPFDLLRKIQDDKTFVCLYNSSVLPKANKPQYYSEPDWKKVAAYIQRRLYPSLFAEQASVVEEAKDQPLEKSASPEQSTDVPKAPNNLKKKIFMRFHKNE